MAWQLWRQDDNGQCYLVDVYATKEKAETRMAELFWLTDWSST